jgi:hypothetical protein
MYLLQSVYLRLRLVYAAPVDNEETLRQRIVDTCQTIRNYPGVFERMRRSIVRRVEASTEYHGRHSEHFFCKCTLAITHKLNIFGPFFSCFGMLNSCPKFVVTSPLYPA